MDLGCLFDCCAAVSSGFKVNSLVSYDWTTWGMVHSSENFNDHNPLETIKLTGAIWDPTNISHNICTISHTINVHRWEPLHHLLCPQQQCKHKHNCWVAHHHPAVYMNLLITNNVIHSTVIDLLFLVLLPAEPNLGLPASATCDTSTLQQPSISLPTCLTPSRVIH